MELNYALLPFTGWGRAQVLAQVENGVRGTTEEDTEREKQSRWEKRQRGRGGDEMMRRRAGRREERESGRAEGE